MTLLEDRSAAFIVRIWSERGDSTGAATEWRGSVEHVQSGQRAFFRHLESIIEFMKPHLESIGIDAQQRFWERISSAMEDEQEADTTEFRIDVAGAPVPAAGAPINTRKSR